MGLKFLNKKGWHPSSLRNMEKVWKAEQREVEETKKLEELKKQIAADKEAEELQRLRQQAGLAPFTQKVDFLYESGLATGKGSTDDLMSKKITLSGPQQLSVSQASSAPGALLASADASQAAAAAGGAASSAAAPSANEQWRRLHSDPLLLIRQQEQAALQRIRSNPVKMEQLKKQAREEKQQRREEKEERRRRKEKKRRRREERRRQRDRGAEGSGDDSNSGREQKRATRSLGESEEDEEEGAHADAGRRTGREPGGLEARRRDGRAAGCVNGSARGALEGIRLREPEGFKEREREEGREREGTRERGVTGIPDRQRGGPGGLCSPEVEYGRNSIEEEGSEGDNRSGHEAKAGGAGEPRRYGLSVSETARMVRREAQGAGPRAPQPAGGAAGGQESRGRLAAAQGGRQRPARGPVSAEEKERRVREMQEAAEEADKERRERLRWAAEREEEERERDGKRLATSFLTDARKTVYGTREDEGSGAGQHQSIEASIKRRSHYLQKSDYSSSHGFRR